MAAAEYYLTRIEGQIQDRLLSDTGLDGLFPAAAADLCTGPYNTEAPQPNDDYWTVVALDPTEDMILFRVRAALDESAMNANGRVVGIDIVVNCNRRSTRAEDGLTRAGIIMERIEGNFDLVVGGVPAYGLQRHKMNMGATGWDAGILQIVSNTPNHDADMYSYILEFQSQVQRNTA